MEEGKGWLNLVPSKIARAPLGPRVTSSLASRSPSLGRSLTYLSLPAPFARSIRPPCLLRRSVALAVKTSGHSFSGAPFPLRPRPPPPCTLSPGRAGQKSSSALARIGGYGVTWYDSFDKNFSHHQILPYLLLLDHSGFRSDIRFCCLLDFGSPGSQVKLPNCRANKVVFWQATCTASDGSPFRISFLSILELDKKEEFLIDPNRNSINASICSFLAAPDLQKILTDRSA